MNIARLTAYLSFVVLAIGSTPALAQTTRTWNGGGENDTWSASNNWGGFTLVGNESLAFGGTARLTNVNDLAADTPFTNITFNSGAGPFRLTGNRIALGGNIANNDGDNQQLDMDMLLAGTRTLNAGSGNLLLNGVLSGSGGLVKSGATTVVLAGDNTYEGATSVNSGFLRITHDRALGSAAGGTTVGNSYRLELGGVSVTGEVVTINGNGGNNNGALQVYAGSNTWAGTIMIGTTDSRIGVTPANGILVVSGVIDDGVNTFNLGIRNGDLGGPVVLAGPNTYKGETKIVVGTVRLSGGDNRLPTNTVLRLGNGSSLQYAVLDLNGMNQTVAGITQDGNMPWSISNSTAVTSTLTVNNRNPYTYAGVLYGNINLTKSGTNTLTLSGNINPFTGQTVVRDGRLALVGPWALQDSTFNTGDGAMGVLALGTNTVVNFGGLVGTNDLVLTNGSGVAVSLRIRGSQTTAYDGRIVTGCDFTKTGTGSFTLKNAGSYTGRTTIINGKLIIPSEDTLGVMPAGFVPDQITFDGGTLRSFSNFVFSADNRGVTLAAGGGTLEVPDTTNTFTVLKTLTGAGALTKRGAGVLILASSNAYDGVTTVADSILRVGDNHALGSTAGGTVVTAGGQLELTNGVTVTGEAVTISGAGMTVTPVPPSAPQVNRGALQAGVNATAEWSGPVFLAASGARVGAQDGGNLIISGVVSDGGANRALQASSHPNDRLRGTVLKGQNTYAGNTEIVRGTLFAGAANTLPAVSMLDVHWSSANNYDYTAFDLNGFDQTIGGLKNSGDSGGNAMVTNSSATAVTLTINQSATTDFGGVLAGKFALVKGGTGTLNLTNRNWYSGATTVSNGTLKIGFNNAIPTNTTLVLAGGTLDVAGKTNTVASLVLTADSTLALDAGKLTVSSQGTDTWSGQLNLTGTLGPTTLRFLPTLSAGQLQLIRADGKHVGINAAGYIYIAHGTLIRVM